MKPAATDINRTAVDTSGMAAAQGEIESFATDRIVITGTFHPGDALELRPGRRVAVFVYDVGACQECEGLEEERDEATDRADVAKHELREAERELEKLRAHVLDLEGQLVDAREALDGALKHQT
ncbi:hypothetical protein [Mycobacterium sp. 1245801.1]|uniref:hypothetical protein n=1 Tax=Mycobacterium sp. 1245801.1 TaxID=1834075 RepID=UPI0007FEC10B|nr:hypothetical protein [Mycobacterium sp. 1245801.1]OBJ24625.1 hypothetical protein A5622_11660 [Mycobacterium sp. 1245801.1]